MAVKIRVIANTSKNGIVLFLKNSNHGLYNLMDAAIKMGFSYFTLTLIDSRIILGNMIVKTFKKIILNQAVYFAGEQPCPVLISKGATHFHESNLPQGFYVWCSSLVVTLSHMI